MKFSEQWLREFVDPPLSTAELVEQLTMAGLEVDGFEPVAADTGLVVVGEILEVSPHPDADKLRVCRVSYGEDDCQVVCGAPNARPGIKIPFALVGAHLGSDKIRKAKLRGVESFGMLCSERELGLSDHHEGLMELPQDAPVGQDIVKFLRLDDAIIDLDLTPNRSDCLGLKGLARETGLINEMDVVYPELAPVLATIEDTFPVELHCPEACPRFVGRVIKGIDPQAQTPLWMREKLRRCNVRSIDPVVDVTNYVMLEQNQPMHAYDLNRLSSRIMVRLSEQGEQLTLLDGQQVSLHADTVLITDESGPIGMGGVMGGVSTAVSESSSDIFLECAFFAPTSIAGQARSYGLNTDAAHRFERGVDWQGQRAAIERATALLIDIAGGKPGPVVDTVMSRHLPVTPEVTLRSRRIERLLGVQIDDETVDGMLHRLGFEATRVEQDGETHWTVKPPSHRFDISIEADLIEEISRVYGYNTLPVRTPSTSLAMPRLPESDLSVAAIKDQLVARCYQEAITYSFVDPAVEHLIDPANEPISLANPLSGEMSVMRTTLWSGLLRSLLYNLNRQQSRIRLFEVGLRFLQPPNLSRELRHEDIRQEKMLAGVACGASYAENWANETHDIDFFDIKGDIESILALTRARFDFRPTSHPALQRGQSAEIRRDGKWVGHVGLLDPRVQKGLDVRVPVYLFEISIDSLITRNVPVASPLSKFPESRRDIAIIVDQDVAANSLQTSIQALAGETLSNLKLFDVYQGKGIDPNRKSIGLGLTFQHRSRNLTDEEINGLMDRIVASLEADFGASLRN
ncbi:MAG: phenylalanine--tRNA ligase subunit beta [Proteobacteria bacterium]|nr:phenylalanine--tRNA ligase subunit beta [Pseudomonadota bacterium]